MLSPQQSSLFCSPSPSSSSSSSPSKPVSSSRRSAVRCLFGRASSPSETSAWLRAKLAEQQREQQQRWHYDFVHDRPLEGLGDYEYEAVAEEELPAFYRQKTISARNRRRSAEENVAPVAAASSVVPDGSARLASVQASNSKTPAVVKKRATVLKLNGCAPFFKTRKRPASDMSEKEASLSPSTSSSDSSSTGAPSKRLRANQ